MTSYYHKVHELVRLIPRGRAANYGQIADYIDGCTPRMVGYALSALPADTDVPWHRVVNAAGGVSPRPGSERQREILEAEGFVLDGMGRIDWSRHRWPGPPARWLAKHGMLP